MDELQQACETEVIGAEAAEVRAPKAEKSLAELLQKQQKAIAAARAAMIRAFYKMAGALEAAEALLPKGHLKRFAVYTCGLEASEISIANGLRGELAGELDLFLKAGLGLPGLKALTSADANVRDSVLSSLKAGTRLKAADITALKREARDALDGPEVELTKARNKAFGQVSREQSKNLLSKLAVKSEELFGIMTPCFAEFSDEDVDEETREKIMELASEALAVFRQAVDVEKLPEEWERQNLQSHEADLGRAHDALIALSGGAFVEVDDEGRPYEEAYAIDRVLYQSVAWLAGKPDLLKPPAPAKPEGLLVKPQQDLVVLEICAGAGGQKLGLNAAGFKTIAAYEFDKHAALTLQSHSTSLCHRVFQKDIRTVDFTPYRDKVDLLAGGVPCQPFSEAGYREGENDDRDLFMETVRIVGEVRPRAFFFENVAGFSKRNADGYRRKLHAAFKKLGYDSQIFHFYGADYGLGQARPRIAFIGFRDGKMRRFKMPEIQPRDCTLVDAIGDLVRANGWNGYDEWVKIANRIAPTIVGGSKSSGKYAYGSNFTKTTWASLGIDSRSLTDQAPGPDHRGLFKLTLRMGARLQGFPDDLEFKGSKMSIKSQIANALPPIMAKLVGLAIHAVLTGTKYDYDAALDQPITTPRRRVYDKRNFNGGEHLDRHLERFFFGETPHLDPSQEAEAMEWYPDEHGRPDERAVSERTGEGAAQQSDAQVSLSMADPAE